MGMQKYAAIWGEKATGEREEEQQDWDIWRIREGKEMINSSSVGGRIKEERKQVKKNRIYCVSAP